MGSHSRRTIKRRHFGPRKKEKKKEKAGKYRTSYVYMATLLVPRFSRETNSSPNIISHTLTEKRPHKQTQIENSESFPGKSRSSSQDHPTAQWKHSSRPSLELRHTSSAKLATFWYTSAAAATVTPSANWRFGLIYGLCEVRFWFETELVLNDVFLSTFLWLNSSDSFGKG